LHRALPCSIYKIIATLLSAVEQFGGSGPGTRNAAVVRWYAMSSSSSDEQ
jgi:hypothetical protein